MKYTTEYLFDKPRSAYEPEITVLATKRIADASKLMKRLSHEKNDIPIGDAGLMDECIGRYMAASEARDWWQKVLEEK